MSEVKDAIKEGLEAIAGSKGVFNDPATLDKYSRDQSLTPPRKPSYVVKPRTLAEVQDVVRLANEHVMPVVPYSSGTDFHGAAVPDHGGILADLGQMNRISELSAHLWSVTVEPGVTFAHLKKELDKHGLRVQVPLLTPPSASVLVTYLEREPVPSAADFIYGNEHIQTMRVVLPGGDSFTMGNPALEGKPHTHPFGPGLDFWRMFMCAQGTMGIVYEMNLRLIPLSKTQKFFFSTFENITDVTDAIKHIQRQELGFECFALNSSDLATLVVEEEPSDAGDLKKGTYVGPAGARPWSSAQRQRFEARRQALPPWTLVLSIAAWARHPEDKVAYQELDLRDLAAEAGFDLKPSVASITGLDKIIADEMLLPWRMQKRFGYKGTCHGLMFYATAGSIPLIEDALSQLAAKYHYSAGDIGAYVQPVERARTYYCVYDLYCDPEDENDVERVKSLFNEASEVLISLGAFFDRPYGPWAEMMYRRDGNYAEYLRKFKAQLDPNNIMNPGKLCF
jgi:FAD/FMN-containing dehydrogenase